LSGSGIPAHRAVALGFVQGPAELLPVSSSAHIVLVPWLAGWDWDEVDPELRKSFEVALHAGAAGALLIGQRRLIAEELREFEMRVAFQMSAADSASFLDNPAATKLRQHRGLFASEDLGTVEKFRPYGIPTDEWLATLRKSIGARTDGGASV